MEAETEGKGLELGVCLGEQGHGDLETSCKENAFNFCGCCN